MAARRGGKRSPLSEAIAQFVESHGATGVHQDVVAQQFADHPRAKVMESLSNMRCGNSMHAVDRVWRMGADPMPRWNYRDWRRAKRAAELDKAVPLVPYGAGLQPPRCPSVWAYARSFQEARA